MNLSTLGWDGDWADALADQQDPALAPARVIAVHRGRVHVCGADGDALVPVAGSSRGGPPVVGDWVGVRAGAIRVVLPRRTTLAREGAELVANADLCVVVTSLNRDLNLRRLERFVTLARSGGLDALVVCSKGDLSPDPSGDADRVAAHAGGAAVLVLSAHDGRGVHALRARLAPRRTAVLVGMSGVGKSTLVNLLLGEARQRTLEVRAGDDRGRHATSRRELFALDGGALLVDTPGLRLPRLTGTDGLGEAFVDVEALAAGCRFGDCRQEREPGCAVQAAIAAGELDPSRLAHLRKLEREGLDARERRERARRVHRRYRKVIATRTRPR